MSIRKREWTTGRGEKKIAWMVDYYDQNGKRQRRQFSQKKNADAFNLTAQLEVRDGTHVADSASATVAEAGDKFIETKEGEDLEETTLAQYREHLRLHIKPFIGKLKLSKLSVPAVRDFADKLRLAGRSSTLVKYVIRSLGSLLADAQERGSIVRNPVHEMRVRRRKGRKATARDRRGSKLKVGIDIPTPDEIKRIVGAATGKGYVFLLTGALTGLRGSEMRGLPWTDVDFKNGELKVTQRADRLLRIGRPKTEAAERTISLPSIVVSALREWKLACPKGAANLVFPGGNGGVAYHVDCQALYWEAQTAAGVSHANRDDHGKLIPAPKYKGLHSLRHFFASWCINRKADGGLELPPKTVQYRMGHSSIMVTMDTYGHLFARADDSAELAAAASSLLS